LDVFRGCIMQVHRRLVFLLSVLLLSACGGKMIRKRASAEHIRAQMEKLSPVELTCDLSKLSDQEMETLKLLVKAARCTDTLFLKQVYGRNLDMLVELKKSTLPEDTLALAFFRVMFGPWNRLDGNKPFLNDRPKPAEADFYPEGMTKEEFESWIKAHPDARNAFESNFTVIRRQNSALAAIPYSRFYQDQILTMSELLNQAARRTADPSLKAYLESRAQALLTDDYYDSDMKWMDLAGDIEVVIGPYEVYEDRLLGYKAAFESFVCLVDHEASSKLQEIVSCLDAMENALPMPQELKRFSRGKFSPIKVVNLVYSAGETKAGVQTAAFNLPNDERVRESKGSKKVMLKNVMRAKFEKCWIPIVREALSEKDLNRVSFDAYFNEVVMHEVSHGLGPGKIAVAGVQTTVNKALKDLYSTVEECKADVLGVLNTQFLIDRGILAKPLENVLYATMLGGMFRSIRFGIDEAHGGGVAIQLNYYLDQGASKREPDGRFSVDDARMKQSVRNLASELLILEAKGDYDGAKAFVQKYRNLRPDVSSVLEKLKNVPVDILPMYPIERDLDSH